MIELVLFFVLLLTVKGTFLRKNGTFTPCCGGQLYGPADRHRILQAGKPDYIESLLV
jgi:hypothetical protein